MNCTHTSEQCQIFRCRKCEPLHTRVDVKVVLCDSDHPMAGMRTIRRFPIALLVVCCLACAHHEKQAEHPMPASSPVTAEPAIPPAAEAPPEPVQLPTRAELIELFQKHDDANTRTVLAKSGIRYIVHELESRSAARVDAPNTEGRVGLLAAPLTVSDEIVACPQLFGEAERNAWHEFDGEWYFVDSAGRPSQAYTTLPPIKAAPRSPTCQTSVGKWGDDLPGPADYDGGHMIGS
jgi:hypothetical protein